MFERLAQIVVIAAKTLCGTDMDDAASSLLEHGIEPAQPHCTKWRGCLRFDFRSCTRHSFSATF
jgi:hypothetical protein